MKADFHSLQVEPDGAPIRPVLRTLDRGLRVLFVVARAGTKLSLEQVAHRAQLSETTTFRILSTLAEHRLVKHDERAGGYTLGVASVELGGAFTQSVDLIAEATPIMAELAERFGQTVNLGTLEGEDVLYLHRVAPPNLLGPMVARPGLRVPATCTGIGKAILAFQPSSQWPTSATHEFPTFTSHSMTTDETLHSDLRAVLARGFSLDLQELAIGVHSAAAPIFDSAGNVTTAISVGGVRDQLSIQRLIDEVGPAVVGAANKLSDQTGGFSRNPRKMEG